MCYNGCMDRRYGINVKKWCRAHEAKVEEAGKKCTSPDELRALLIIHEKRLSWLMHERLIHLIVLFITVILVIFAMSLMLFLPETLPASLPMFAIAFILLIFYVRHYFFLENTVQYWYTISEKLESGIFAFGEQELQADGSDDR
ncbi:MAG: hypothetical protein K6G58_09525 [Lachnospiraceae bacterium]|nr:hypothetical protein [Lachnospiraceae bacterium]